MKHEELVGGIGRRNQGEVEVAQKQAQRFAGRQIGELGRDAARAVWFDVNPPMGGSRDFLEDTQQLGRFKVGADAVLVGAPEQGIGGGGGNGESQGEAEKKLEFKL